MGNQGKTSFSSSKRKAFHHLKEKLSSEPVLILPDLRKAFVVQCDACGHSIGAVLMQEGHEVAYESRILLPTKKSLQVYEKEVGTFGSPTCSFYIETLLVRSSFCGSNISSNSSIFSYTV